MYNQATELQSPSSPDPSPSDKRPHSIPHILRPLAVRRLLRSTLTPACMDLNHNRISPSLPLTPNLHLTDFSILGMDGRH